MRGDDLAAQMTRIEHDVHRLWALVGVVLALHVLTLAAVVWWVVLA